MNKFFADWHREIAIDPASIDIEAREAAGDKFAEECNKNDIVALVATAYGQPCNPQVIEPFREAFKVTDPSFPMRGNDNEMKLLAAAVLEQACRQEDAKAVMTGYFIKVANHIGWDSPFQDLHESAVATITKRSLQARDFETSPAIRRPAVYTSDLKTEIEAISTSGSYPPPVQTAKALTDIASNTQAAFNAMVKYQQTQSELVEFKTSVLTEESSMLWWLLSGASKETGEPWAKFTPRAMAVQSARELASIIRFLPAPPQSDGLLRQIIGYTRTKEGLTENTIAQSQTQAELSFMVTDFENSSEEPIDVARHALDEALLIKSWTLAK